MYKIPTFNEYISEGILTNYRAERESMKLTYNQLSGSFDEFVNKLIEEKIPFYFDCKYKEFSRVGYLMNESINNVHFNGYILDNNKSIESLKKEFDEHVLKDIVIEKGQKLHIGRSPFSDLTKANDLDIITTVVKGVKDYSKTKSLDKNYKITGNKLEAHIPIILLSESTRVNDIIDYVF